MQRVFNAKFFLLQFSLGRGPDLDQRHPARQFGDALVKLFALVLAVQRLALLPYGGDALAQLD